MVSGRCHSVRRLHRDDQETSGPGGQAGHPHVLRYLLLISSSCFFISVSLGLPLCAVTSHQSSAECEAPLLWLVPQALWVCSTCCCCGPASWCCTTPASRPSSCPASWSGPTSSSTASSEPSCPSSCGCGESLSVSVQPGPRRLRAPGPTRFSDLEVTCAAALCPQGLFPHLVSHRDSGAEPHHPALHHGRYLHAEGEILTTGAFSWLIHLPVASFSVINYVTILKCSCSWVDSVMS